MRISVAEKPESSKQHTGSEDARLTDQVEIAPRPNGLGVSGGAPIDRNVVGAHLAAKIATTSSLASGVGYSAGLGRG
jgi:hypothetical protein